MFNIFTGILVNIVGLDRHGALPRDSFVHQNEKTDGSMGLVWLQVVM